MAKRILEQLDPDTAPKGRSVWDGINCGSFERQSQALFDNKQHVPGRRCYTGTTQESCATDSHAIPLEIERILTDDLAFIAASQPQVDSVSAVAMEQNNDSHAVLFRLAANEGVTSIVKDHFDQLFAVLRSHARKGIRLKSTKEFRFMQLTLCA
jgi:hypothetical protein